MFTGIKLYAAVGLLVLLAGLASWGYIEHQRVEIADQKVLAVTKERDSLSAQLVQSEADKKQLVEEAKATDAIVSAQREKERTLENEKAQIWQQFDKAIKAAPKADQDCASRPLPPSVLDLLRDGPGDGDAVSKGQDPGKPATGLPENKPS